MDFGYVGEGVLSVLVEMHRAVKLLGGLTALVPIVYESGIR